MARLDRHQYLMHIGYDGSRFFGVVPQRHGPTVASALRARLELATDQRAGALNFTARTDRGVWAEQNFATCWFLPPFDPVAFELEVERPRDDGLFNVKAERTGFHTHARNVGAGKWYRYRVRTDGAVDDRCWAVSRPLDMASIVALASAFVGTHDFRAYRFKCGAPDTRKTLSRVEVQPFEGGFDVHIEGDGFLRQMVRKLVSVMVLVGLGEYELDRAIHLLESAADKGTPKAAPPEGLTLMAIRRAQT